MSRSLKPAVLACALMGAGLLTGCDRQSGEPAQPKAEAAAGKHELSGTLDRSHAGEALPDLTLADAAGNEIVLSSLTGKPVLVNLWATWCAPCVVELPMLDQISREYDGRMRVVTVSQDMQQTEKVAPFLAERGLNELEPWLDPQSDLTFALGAQTLPTTILYNAAGKEVWRYIGGTDWTGSEAARLLSEAIPQE